VGSTVRAQPEHNEAHTTNQGKNTRR